MIKILRVATVFLSVCSFLYADQRFAGKSLEEALRLLQLQGLNILYSSNLVHEDMKVMEEPQSMLLRQVLDELLSPHGLHARSGPANTLLVVSSPPPAPVSGQPGSAGIPKEDYVVVPFVTLYFNVEHVSRRFKLNREHLTLLENGLELPIVDFKKVRIEDEPSTVFFLLDQSKSMKESSSAGTKQELLREAAVRILDEFRSSDLFMAFGFSDTLHMINKPTHDPDEIRRSLKACEPSGTRTALFDSLNGVLEILRDYPGRKILLLFSDGEDTMSQISTKSAVDLLLSSNINMYCFGVRSATQRGRETMEKFAEITGGYAYFTGSFSETTIVVNQAREDLKNQYAVGFVPRNPFYRGLRSVRLESRQPGLRLHYRKTYHF